jgi:hypothetical protein
MKKYLSLCIFSLFVLLVRAQVPGERLSGLHANPVLLARQQAVQNRKIQPLALSAFSNPYLYSAKKDTFLDDFSYPGPYPDSARWLDNKAFINYNFPVAPINLGVATLDGLDPNGYPWNFHGSANISVPCDTLTSKRIEISLTSRDSFYFSFYYQAQGRGFAPRNTDSLLLEFKSSHDSLNWKEVWSLGGYSSTYLDTGFRRVLIPLYNKTDSSNYLADTAKYPKGTWFQFRFRNYAIPSGNVSQWNIDYVYLAPFRTVTDTSVGRISMAYEPLSFLKKYQNMPWKQFQGLSDMADSAHLYFRNNFTSLHNMSYSYTGYHYGVPLPNPYSPKPYPNMPPFDGYGYSKSRGTAYPLVAGNGFTFPSPLTDTTVFQIKHILFEGISGLIDTIQSVQRFYNYYAYDDGTAELGYGLEGVGTSRGAQLAVQFSTNVPDTLRAVQFFWNPILRDASLDGFRLCVWAAGSGQPGKMIYRSDSTFNPQYLNGYNHYRTYLLDHPLAISGTFYVGWLQYTDANMSVGFDRNTNSMTNNFFKVDSVSSWQGSLFPGSLMIRPLFGDTIRMTGITEIKQALELLSLYPNPAQDRIYISMPESTDPATYTVSVISTCGKLILETAWKPGESLDVSRLENGFYLVRINSRTKYSATRKLLIAR